MKRYLIAILFIMAALPAGAREVYSLNRGWKFFTGHETKSDGAPTVDLPHTWNADATAGNKYYFRGVGNYLREIDAPAAWRGRRVFIKGYGANSVSHVFVNGRLAGEHRGGQTAFCHEITTLLRTGQKNYIRIIVNNSPQFDVLPTAGDANVYGGLFRDVELIVTGEETIYPADHASDGVYIRPKKVTARKVEAEAVVCVSGLRDNNNGQVRIAVIGAEGDTVAAESAHVRIAKEATATVPFSFDNPHLWNGTADPHLYTVSVTLLNDKKVIDEVLVKTGFRFFSVDPEQGFMLNGKPYPLRGVVAHQDRPVTANALLPAHVEEDLRLIAGMGANAVRVAGGPHHPSFYDICDREGIVVWSDFPLTGDAYLTDIGYVGIPSYRANALSQATDIIRQQYNHPSVIMWGLFSNMRARGDNPVPLIRELSALTKKEDPSRLTTASSNEDGEINFITDLISWDHYLGWREGQPGDINAWRRHLRAEWKILRSAVSYGAGASIYQQGDSLRRPAWQGAWHPERWQTHLHEEYLKNLSADPAFWGIFVANMFDYGAVSYPGGRDQGVNDMGLVTFDRKDCKDAYYLYKACWNDRDPFVYIAERRWTSRRNPVQTIRIYSNLEEVELYVNGVPCGTKTGSMGVFTWSDPPLKAGVNLIEARAGDFRDSARIEITASAEPKVILSWVW